MHQKIQEDENLITGCNPGRYGVQGNVVYSKGGRIENITNIRTTGKLRDIHRTLHQLRTTRPEIPVQRCSLIDVAPILDAAAEADDIHAERDRRRQWYRTRDNTAVACRWEPGNSHGTHRLAHYWVAPDYRDEGKGEALVRARIVDALQDGANRIDAYARQTDLYERLGFEITDRATADGHDHVQLTIGYPDDCASSNEVAAL
jgi:predicted GNAT family N-acyltransferase